jgi:uncharacterized protein
MPSVFERSVELPVHVAVAFAWHARPGALQRMIPPFDPVQIIENAGSIRDGSRVVIQVPMLGPIKKTWVAEHFGYQENVQFCDRQVSGPFAFFEHTHRFERLSDNSSKLTDHIEYRPPLGPVGALGEGMIRRKMEHAFAWRQRTVKEDLTRHAEYLSQPRLKIAVTGSTGLVASVLIPFLTTGGHQVVRLLRKAPTPTRSVSEEGPRRSVSEPASARPSLAHASGWYDYGDGTSFLLWNPDKGEIDAAGLEGIDAVIHLAGDSIATGRWTAAKKERILQSRVKSTTLLAQTLAKLKTPPKVFFSTSAIGYYPPSGDTPLTEQSPTGTGFLPEVCQAWEAATKPAEDAGIRTVHGRVGVVLTPAGGALSAQLPLFRWGVAGRLGDGKQYVPWITIDDLVYAINHCVQRSEVRGPVNLTAPTPVTNLEFTKTLGRILWRPTILPAPAFALRLALGEMADALLFASLRVIPERLQQQGFRFAHPTLDDALRHVLGTTTR